MSGDEEVSWDNNPLSAGAAGVGAAAAELAEPKPWAFQPGKAGRKVLLKRAHWEVGEVGGKGIALVFGDDDSRARLIAGAPDMLDAIEFALDDMREGGLCVCEQTKELLQAAIAKARAAS